MIWLLGGYMWLFVHRPYEIYDALGAIQLERGYMFLMVVAWLVTPNKTFTANRIHYALAAFTAVLLVTWLASPYSGHPGCADTVESYCKVAVFYLLVVTTVRDERQLRLLVLLFLAGTGLYMLHSLWEYLHGRIEWRQGISRMIGVDISYRDPNAFASTMLYTLPMLLPFWSERPRRLPRWLVAGYAACAIFCILRTGSRAGFMGLGLLTVLVVLICSRRKMQAVLLLGLTCLAGLTVFFVALPGELQDRYLTLVDPSRGPANAQESAEGRMDGFLWGMYVWQQSPLLGHGPGSFGYSTGRNGQAHNLYGQVMSEMGLAGAACLLGVVLCFAANALESRRLARGLALPGSDLVRGVATAVGLDLVLLLVLGWSGHNLFRYNWQWFAAFSSIAVCCLRRRAVAEGAAFHAAPQGASLAWH